MPIYDISATLVVDFENTAGDGSVLLAEIDNRSDGYNDGDTSFIATDEPAYLLYKTDDVIIDSYVSTLVSPNGTIITLATETREVEKILVFANTNKATLTYPIKSGFDFKWLGKNPGVNLSPDGQITITTPSDIIAVARVTYNTEFTAYRMTNTPAMIDSRSDYSVLIYIVGHTE